jgi:hypothetical protein
VSARIWEKEQDLIRCGVVLVRVLSIQQMKHRKSTRGNAMYVTTKHITSMSVMFCAVQVNAHFFINWYSLEWYIIFHKQTKEKEEPFWHTQTLSSVVVQSNNVFHTQLNLMTYHCVLKVLIILVSTKHPMPLFTHRFTHLFIHSFHHVDETKWSET